MDTTPTHELTMHEARWIAVIASGLDRRPFRRKPTRADILDVVRRLGCVQLDTISVISRSHETVLWSRLGPYDLRHWVDLFSEDRALTEYLAHAAAIIPMDTLPLYRSLMERYRVESGWSNVPENRATMVRVLDQIRTHGPIGSRHFETPEGSGKADPWEWYGAKPERQAIAALWVRGEIVLSLRDRGFARSWSLAEDALPRLWAGESIPVEQRDRVFISRALDALGVTTCRWASDYYRSGGSGHVSMKRTRTLLGEMVETNAAIPVGVRGIDEPMWLAPSMAGVLEDLRAGRRRPTLTTFLSPFDNLVWNRDRCEQLWNFDYRLECYVPAPKRKYGYYNMPILYRGHLVGRLDPSFDRKTRLLTIKSLHLEPGMRLTDAMTAAIRAALDDLTTFLGGSPGAWVLTGQSLRGILQPS